MTEPTPLIDRIWERSSRPEDHRPENALHRALSQLASGELADVEHIVVCIGRSLPGETASKRLSYLQAGKYNQLEQVGLLDSIRHMMNE